MDMEALLPMMVARVRVRGTRNVRYKRGFGAFVLALAIAAGAGHAQAAQPDPGALFQQYRLSAAQGNPAGLDGLGTLFERGSNVPVDFAKAYALFHLAASRQGADPALVARASEHRDELGARMTRDQLVRVNELIALCNGSDVNRCGEIIITAGVPPGTLASVQPARDVRMSRDGKMIVPLEAANGIFVVPAIVNGVMTLKFAVDTGAADVSIPANVVKSLVDAGFIAQADFLGQRTYRIADGSTMPSQTFRLRTLQVGNVLIEDVMASVVPDNAPLLLGQSFLRRLKSWSMDNTAHALIIE